MRPLELMQAAVWNFARQSPGMNLRCDAAHRSICIKHAEAFIVVCRLLLPPALHAGATF
jgi:hypothetical protein